MWQALKAASQPATQPYSTGDVVTIALLAALVVVAAVCWWIGVADDEANGRD